MELHIRFLGEYDPELVYGLRDELDLQSQVPVYVQVKQSNPEPNRLGSGPELISVILGAGGTVPVLLAVVGRWLRRAGRAELEVKGPNGGRIRWSAYNLRGLTTDQMNDATEHAVRQLAAIDDQHPHSDTDGNPAGTP